MDSAVPDAGIDLRRDVAQSARRTARAPMPRVAVIGAGYFGELHASKYAALAHCHLAAIVDAVPQRALAVAERFGVAAYSHHGALAGLVDAVSVATPVHTHHAITRDCLRLGMHVLVEKPIAATREQAAELAELAGTCGRVLQIGHVERFNPAVRHLHRRGARPRQLHCRRLAPPRPRGTDVDVVLDLMIHDLDLARMLMQRDAVAVHASGSAVRSTHLDVVEAWIDFGGDHSAHLLASRIATRSERSIELHCADGRHFADLRTGYVGLEPDQPSGPDVPFDPLCSQLSSFLHCVRLGQPPEVDAGQGLAALDLALRVRSAVERR